MVKYRITAEVNLSQPVEDETERRIVRTSIAAALLSGAFSDAMAGSDCDHTILSAKVVEFTDAVS